MPRHPRITIPFHNCLRLQMAPVGVVFTMATVGSVACNGSEVPSPAPTIPSTPAATTYSIQLSPVSVTLPPPPSEPRSVVVKATVRTNTGEIVSQAAVEWSTDSPRIATVSQAGTVAAAGEGTTLLHARFQGTEARGLITVVGGVNFTVTGSMSESRLFHTATLLADGRVLIAGGSDGGTGARVSAEVYDPGTGTFTRTGDMTRPRSQHSATLLPSGKVLIAGGIVGTEMTRTAELYDPTTGKFTQTGDMRGAQLYHRATLLTTGKVLISGGISGWSGCCPIADNPELYDPATGAFTTTGTYAGANVSQETTGLLGTNATLLRDGRVLLSMEPAAQLYDPATGAFSRTGTMTTGIGFLGSTPPPYINGRTATLLDDGKVLLTGGHHEDIGRFDAAELYDPSTGKFAATGSMAYVRDGHAATLLGDGSVLITGGEGESGCSILSLAAAELYVPSNGGVVPGGTMAVRREWHTATRLKDGRVLVTGGITFDGGICSLATRSILGNAASAILSSAELYIPHR